MNKKMGKPDNLAAGPQRDRRQTMITDRHEMTITSELAPKLIPAAVPSLSLSPSAKNPGVHYEGPPETQYDASGMPDDRRGRAERFRTLRRDVAGIEGRASAARLPLGVESLDSALAGGLAPGRVHLLSGRPGHDGALTGFTIALLRRVLAHVDGPRANDSRANDSRADVSAPVVWCPAAAAGASGMLYAAGLAALGIDPGRLLIVDSPSPGQRLAALEDILRTSGLAAVILEYDGVSQSGDYWMRLARRAQLAAEASGVTGFLTGWPVTASGFETQWRIAPAPNPGPDLVMHHHLQPSHRLPSWSPCWQVDLLQARGGRPHATRLCWQAQDNRFRDLGPANSGADSGADAGVGIETDTATPKLPLALPDTGGGLPRRVVGHRQAAARKSVSPPRLAGNLAGNLAG